MTGEREEITLSFEQNSGLFIQAGRCVVGWLVVYKGQRKVILIWKTVHERTLDRANDVTRYRP